jgi:hypothetical protein
MANPPAGEHVSGRQIFPAEEAAPDDFGRPAHEPTDNITRPVMTVLLPLARDLERQAATAGSRVAAPAP